MVERRFFCRLAAAALLMLGSAAALAADKPNILVIWGDDVGQSNPTSAPTARA